MRIGLTTLVVGAVAAGAISTAAGRTEESEPTAPNVATCRDGEEHQAWVEGDADAVAARLPEGYEPETDQASGKPLVFVRASHCRAFSVGGRTAPTTLASWGVVVKSPDGRGCGSGAPGAGEAKGDVPPICNWYPLSVMSDNEGLVTWLREGTPAVPAIHVPGLKYEVRETDPASGETPFHFEAPAPAPSPFTIDDVSTRRPGELALRGGYWSEVPQGTVKLALSTGDLGSGTAESVARAAPGSELAKLMGATERSSVAPHRDFGLIYASEISYWRELAGPARPGERLTSFDGSCSLEGLVTFTPPARNDQQPTRYTYDAEGTCTGVLDGREVSDIPVVLAQAGRSDASCMKAHTFPPGNARLAFRGGPVLTYTVDFTAALTEVDIELYGTRSGEADGHSTFATPRTPPDVPAKCGGEGLPEAPMDLEFTTRTPLVSARAERLRARVSPRRVAAGRSTRFVFRVTANGRPVRGALVRFAGREERTGRGGRAVIRVALARAGRHVARARKPGFRGAAVAVRVMRR
jgi:hypothetical protein